jgi:hypothetical protein
MVAVLRWHYIIISVAEDWGTEVTMLKIPRIAIETGDPSERQPNSRLAADGDRVEAKSQIGVFSLILGILIL